MSPIALPVSFRRSLLIAAGLFTASISLAQSDSGAKAAPGMEKDWYKVEMIVFAQGGETDQAEIWRTDIKLDYPLNWMELLSPDELQARIAEREQASAADAEGVDSVLGAAAPGSPPRTGNEIVQDDRNLDAASVTGAAGTASPPKGSGSAEGSTGEAAPLTPVTALAQKTLLLLPPEEFSLTSEARRLSRSNQHRVLFHGAWLQPLTENRNQPSILISGGERFDEHHQLEGSVNLYRRTYLHIETDLWLSRFATNFGQEHRPWPSLPWPPNRTPEPDFLFRIDDGGTGLWHQFNQGQGDDISAILSQPYVVDNVVLMQQGRRMRSDELHYIDHPEMGLLIKITPYEPSEAEGDGELRSQ